MENQLSKHEYKSINLEITNINEFKSLIDKAQIILEEIQCFNFKVKIQDIGD